MLKEQIVAVHHKQILNDMRVARLRAGLLLNFNVAILPDRMSRKVLRVFRAFRVFVCFVAILRLSCLRALPFALHLLQRHSRHRAA